MVIPWVGFPLRDLLKRFEPNGNAQFVEFTTVLRPQEMVGQRQRFPSILRYSNVNPRVNHPGHSQARERRIGEFFMRETLMFNGHGDQVVSLYTGMHLRKFY
jgi:hypothetical protein